MTYHREAANMFVYSEDVEAQLKEAEKHALDEVISKVMALQARDIVSGAGKIVVIESWVRAGLGCSVSCGDRGLIALFFVTASDIPAPTLEAMLTVSGRVQELLLSVCESGFKILPEPENFRRLEVPHFEGLVLVCTEDEEQAIRAALSNCGGNCKCATAAAPRASIPTLCSPGGPSDRPPEEGERCVS